MAHKYKKELQELSDYLQLGIDTTRDMKQPELSGVINRVNANLRRDQNFIHSLLGTPATMHEDERVHLKPLTSIFGQKIVVEHKPLSQNDMQPSLAEKDKFIAEVNDFYTHFPQLEDEKIFNKSTLPGGEMVIRAVAKRAGYPEYESADIDVNYIAAVKLHIEDKASKQATLDEAAGKI